MTYQKPDSLYFFDNEGRVCSLEEEFPVGIHVINFGILARVIGYHSLAKMLIVRDVYDGQKWLADPNKCTIPAQRPARQGLVPVIM